MERVYEGNLVEVFRISPRLYFRKANLAERGQCNSAFIVGDTCVGIVDPSTPEAAREMLDEIRLLFNKPLGYVFLTHNHDDHADGMPVFFDLPVTVFCSHKCAPDLAAINNGPAVISGVWNRLDFLIDGYMVELQTIEDVAHSPWDMLVRLPDDGVVCTGDLVVDYRDIYFHYANPERWVAALRGLAKGRDEHILPGHGDIFPAEMTGSVADYIETLLRAAQQCIDDNFTGHRLYDISYERLNELVDAYLLKDSPLAQEIKQKGGSDAQRELRMVVRNLYYHRVC